MLTIGGPTPERYAAALAYLTKHAPDPTEAVMGDVP